MKTNSDPDSDSSDDEETQKLRSALDPTFSVDVRTRQEERDASAHKTCTNPYLSSKKDTAWDSGHQSQTFQISVETKKFIAKRLSEALDKQIKEVAKKHGPQSISRCPDDDCGGIFLFTKSLHPICGKDLNDEVGVSPRKQKRPEVKRRKLEDINSHEESEAEKLKSAAVSFDWVVNKNT